jgi:hypothetical protein
MCDRLVEAMAKGRTAEAAAVRIGITPRSLLYWQQHPEFLQAIPEGRRGINFGGRNAPLPWLTARRATRQVAMLELRNRTLSAGTSVLSEAAYE